VLPPALVIEFVPHVASGLNDGARRVLVVGGGVAIALLASTVVLLLMLKQRDALERRLEQSRQLAALGEVSAVLAHQFRNPLAALKGHAQLLSGSLPDGAERVRADRVVREARRLEELCNDLLDLVRSSRLDRRETPLHALLEESASIVDPSRIVVSASEIPELWSLDATKMQQVLINVLDNAVLASGEGAVELTASVDRSGLIVRVRDHGPGIDEGEEERIFEPFHTGRATGTGLGLAVARRIVALHGGSIQASNHPKGGAVFTIEIPSTSA
jgi:two-component system sensor histidine kinase HydH